MFHNRNEALLHLVRAGKLNEKGDLLIIDLIKAKQAAEQQEKNRYDKTECQRFRLFDNVKIHHDIPMLINLKRK